MLLVSAAIAMHNWLSCHSIHCCCTGDGGVEKEIPLEIYPDAREANDFQQVVFVDRQDGFYPASNYLADVIKSISVE